jgi:CheY-like chemotaxis protein
MATDCIPQVTFQGDGFAKPVVARFDQPQASTAGGLVLVKALDTQLGLSERVAACLDDAREPGKVRHETIELLQQRVFGLCGGYADCNDAARLVHDPIHKLMVGRDPLTGRGLASQPTLSRFENAVTARELRAMTHVLADTVIAQQRRRLHGRATRITLDLDPTDDPTHGQQEFAFFNGHYDTWCYLPVVATVTFNDEPTQFAVAAVLRPGKAPAGLGARGILRALLRKLRAAFPAAQRGYSRDHRPDCKQVVVGLVLDRDGFPKAHEVFDGNLQDRTTLDAMLTVLEGRTGRRGGATVVIDRGMAFADLRMPGISGLEALTYFRQHHRTVPVIVISGDTGQESAQKARAGGAFDVVAKPFAMATLQSLVAQAMRLAPRPRSSN